MFSILNTTEYPIILDGDENATALEFMEGLAASAVRVQSQTRYGDKVCVGMVTERSAECIKAGMPRYAYTGYGFPDSVETDSAMSINKVVVLSVREWAEANRVPRGLADSSF